MSKWYHTAYHAAPLGWSERKCAAVSHLAGVKDRAARAGGRRGTAADRGRVVFPDVALKPFGAPPVEVSQPGVAITA